MHGAQVEDEVLLDDEDLEAELTDHLQAGTERHQNESACAVRRGNTWVVARV